MQKQDKSKNDQELQKQAKKLFGKRYPLLVLVDILDLFIKYVNADALIKEKAADFRNIILEHFKSSYEKKLDLSF